MDDELMKCPVCGTPRPSRYAAYCQVCGSQLPELPPDPNDVANAGPAHQGWEDPASAAGVVFGADEPGESGAGDQPDSYPTGYPPQAYSPGAYPAGAFPPGPGPVRQDFRDVQAGAGQATPAGGAVRVYDRPETPPSVVRRRRLTWILAAVGVVISLLMLTLGPLRTVLGARGGPDWAPPGTATPASVAFATLPPGVSAAQATARARFTPATAPTWTPGVAVATGVTGGGAGGTSAGGNNAGGTNAGGTNSGGTNASGNNGGAAGGVAGGVLATAVLPTLAPAPTDTPVPPTMTPIPPTMTAVPPAATAQPSSPTTAAPVDTPVPAASTPGASPQVGGSAAAGANLPAAISGGKVIAFVSDRSGSPQIWLTAAGGGNTIQVTRDGTNTSPSWSYDDRYLYYVGQRGGQTGVYRLDMTTGREEQLVQDPTVVSARPLPDGQLAVLRTENGRYSLFIGGRRLFQLDRAFQFQFSPDGSLVLIDPNVDPRVVSVVNVATTKATDVAPARSWNASWGQGNRLAYVSDRTGIASVYVAGPNGENARAVSPGDKWSQAPAFSSDGSQIAFIGGDGPAWNVYLVGADGQNAQKVGGPANPNKSPAWQPGGGLIAYESNRNGNWDIYVTDASGKERPLVTGPGNDVDPAWTW